MKRLGRLLATAAKWGGILALIYVANTFLIGLDFESRTGWYLVGLALAIIYVESSLKERIETLEYRVDELTQQRHGRW